MTVEPLLLPFVAALGLVALFGLLVLQIHVPVDDLLAARVRRNDHVLVSLDHAVAHRFAVEGRRNGHGLDGAVLLERHGGLELTARMIFALLLEDHTRAAFCR